jgi:hypothetical protein
MDEAIETDLEDEIEDQRQIAPSRQLDKLEDIEGAIAP